jgi:hypothetical protein
VEEESIRIKGEFVPETKRFDKAIDEIPKKINRALAKGVKSVQPASALNTQNSSRNSSKSDSKGGGKDFKKYEAGGSISESAFNKSSNIYSQIKSDKDSIVNLFSSIKTIFAKSSKSLKPANNETTSTQYESQSVTNSKSVISSANITIQNASLNGIGGIGGKSTLDAKSHSSIKSEVSKIQKETAKESGSPLAETEKEKKKGFLGAIASNGASALATSGGVMRAAMSNPYTAAAALTIGAGAMIVGDSGEKYENAIMSQAGTFGATGGYVGGGGGYFDNSSVAQGVVEYGKASGKNIYGKGTKGLGIGNDIMRFASGNNESLGSVLGSIATLQKNNGGKKTSLSDTLSLARGGANAVGYTNMRQAEYLQKMGGMSEQYASQGLQLNVAGFSSLAGGLSSKNMNMTADQKFQTAEKLQNSATQGPFGDAFGQMAFAKAMEENEGDIHKAMIDLEKNPHKYATALPDALKDSPEALGLYAKQTGMGSYTQWSGYASNPKKVTKDKSLVKAGGNMAVAHKNTMEGKALTPEAREALKGGYKMAETKQDAQNTATEGIVKAIMMIYDFLKELKGDSSKSPTPSGRALMNQKANAKSKPTTKNSK